MDNLEKSYFKYEGQGLEVAILFLKNIILTMITLGIYRPWARTNMRQYLWSHTVYQGDRGSYTGTGKELFKGWCRLVGILFLMLIALSVIRSILSLILPNEIVIGIGGLLGTCIYLYIFSIATYSGFRYRMSRTLWRRIRFGVERDKSQARDFSNKYIGGLGLTTLTFGVYYPVFKNKVHKYLVSRGHFGNLKFSYSGDNFEYFKLYWKNMFFLIITAGIYTPWFIKNTLKYRLEHTHLGAAHFGMDLKGLKVLQYGILSYFCLLLTFGLASPWIYNWGCSLFINNIYLTQNVDLLSVQQTPETLDGATGDDFASAYDLDFGF